MPRTLFNMDHGTFFLPECNIERTQLFRRTKSAKAIVDVHPRDHSSCILIFRGDITFWGLVLKYIWLVCGTMAPLCKEGYYLRCPKN